MKQEILLVKIQNALKKGDNYYEATRGNWKISAKRLANIQYVAGVSNGKIVCLFVPTLWEIVETEGKDKGRKRFEGKEGSEKILVSLQESEDKVLKKFGRGSAIAYISLSELEKVNN